MICFEILGKIIDKELHRIIVNTRVKVAFTSILETCLRSIFVSETCIPDLQAKPSHPPCRSCKSRGWTSCLQQERVALSQDQGPQGTELPPAAHRSSVCLSRAGARCVPRGCSPLQQHTANLPQLDKKLQPWARSFQQDLSSLMQGGGTCFGFAVLRRG